MTDSFPIITRTRLEKAAADNGFDIDRKMDGFWLCFESSHAPGTLWLMAGPAGAIIAAFSHPGVVAELGDHDSGVTISMPERAFGARSVEDFTQLHALLRRVMSLARTLPDVLCETFSAKTAYLPRTTEAELLVVQRVGQDLFRNGLLEYWNGCCAITGLAVPGLLRASHIKPWADCETDAERLDVFNGLLLAPHLDAAFDRGFITIEDDGRVIVSNRLSEDARTILGLDTPLKVQRVASGHLMYLPWHREKVFRDSDTSQPPTEPI